MATTVGYGGVVSVATLGSTIGVLMIPGIDLVGAFISSIGA